MVPRRRGVCSAPGYVPAGGQLWRVFVMGMILVASNIGGKTEAAIRKLDFTGNRESFRRTAYACEEENLILECQRGEVIRILNANYGRFTISVCNKHGQTEGLNLQCRFAKSKDIISERCDGRRKCEMLVNNLVFGDPCPSTSKYAEVKYNCELAPTEPLHHMSTTTSSNIRHDPDSPRRPINLAPKPPVITHVKPVSSTEIEITWQQMEPESPIITTVINYVDKGVSDDPMTFYSSSKGFETLRNLRSNAVFDISLKSFNNYGPSPLSNLVRVTTPPAATLPTSPRTSISSMTRTTDLEFSHSTLKATTSETVVTPTYISGIDFDKTSLSSLLTLLESSSQDPSTSNMPRTSGNVHHMTSSNQGHNPSSSSSVYGSTVKTVTESPTIYIKVSGSHSSEGQSSKVVDNTATLPSSSESASQSDLNVNSIHPGQHPDIPDPRVNGKEGNGLKQSIPTNQYVTNQYVTNQYVTNHVLSLPTHITTHKGNNSLSGSEYKDSNLGQRTTLSSNYSNFNNNSNNNNAEFSHSLSNPWTKNNKLDKQAPKDDDPKLGSLNQVFLAERRIDSSLNALSFIKADERKRNNSDVQSPALGPTTTTTTTTTTTKPTTPKETKPITPPLPPLTTTTTTTTASTTENIPTTAEPIPPHNKKDGKDNGEVDPSTKGHRRFCPEKEVDGVLWPRTRYGRIVERECPKPLIGMSTWVCLRKGWEKNGPDESWCTSKWLQPLDSLIQNVLEGKEAAEEAVVSLSDMMQTKDMSAGDLRQTATKLLPKLSHGMMRDKHHENKLLRKRRLKKFKKAFMKTSSLLLAHRQTKAWHHLPRHERLKAATSVMLAVEDTGYQTAAMMDVGSSDVTIDENIIMEVNVLGQQQSQQDVQFPSQSDLSSSEWKGLRDVIRIPSSSLRVASQRGPVNIVFTIYKNMEELIQPDSESITSSSATLDSFNSDNTIIDSDNAATSTSVSKIVINTNIISASINSPKSHWKLPEPIKFTLHHLQESKGTPMCSFWDIDESILSGSWSQKGCRVVDSNSTHTTCECNHLTNFAVLMDVSGEEMSEDHELALRVITYVGCVVSIFCLMLSWITFMVFKNLQCDRNTIHKNLVLCLMVAEIIFLAGIVQTEPKILCSIIAGLLHYFFLGAFAWMCLEGVQLYVMLIEVFELEKSRVKWYYLFGYGVPLAIVSTSAGVRHGGYGTEKHCWLSTDNYFIWSFIGPALAVILINLGMLSIAICTMCRHSNVSATMKERSKVAKFNVSETYSSMETFAPAKLRFPELPAWVKGAVVLVVLLGLTWILGVFYLNQESLVMAYAFTIFNSLQGLFIFVFHCLMNEKVQKEYRKVARRTSWLPNCVRVNYGGYAGVSSSPNASSGTSGNYFSRLFGPRRRKQSATSTHSSMKPFLNKDQHRRSDTTENSSSRDSSIIPSSLNGYVYTPHYNGNHVIIPYNNNGGLHKPGLNGHILLEPCYETVGEGIAGELSEFIDCSMVDSEMVSEYCKTNFQVCHEQRRYSTGSENSGYEVPRDVINLQLPPQNEVDCLSTLSCASSFKKPASSFVSTSDMGTRSDLDVSVGGQEEEEDEQSLDFHLEQYIIPTKRKDEFDQPYDQKSSSMNKLTKPSIPVAGIIPDGDQPSSPHHSSSPNIEFRPGFSTQLSNTVPAPVIHPDSTDQRDLASSPPEASDPSSLKSSLPNLAVEISGDVLEHVDSHHQRTTSKARPSSEADMSFSPFRFSKSDC